MKRWILLSALLLSTTCARGQWVYTGGPSVLAPTGGAVSAFVVSGDSVFGGTSSGVFLSTDVGVSWNILPDSGLGGGVSVMVVCGPYIFAGIDGDGLFRSSDKGKTWQPAWNGINDDIESLATIDTVLFASTQTQGLFCSTDYGITWESNYTGITTNWMTCMMTDGANLFAGTGDGSGLFLSSDTGKTWIPSGLSGYYVQCLQRCENYLYAGGFYAEGVLRSSDNGMTWSAMDSGLHVGTKVGSYCTVLSIIPSGHNVIIGTAQGAFISKDSGASWSPLDSGLAGSNEAINVLTNGGTNILLGTNGSGFYRSIDGGATWNAADSSIAALSITTLIADDTTILAASSYNGIYRSTDEGSTWTNVSNLQVSSFAEVDSVFFAATGRLYRSTDDGITWVAADSALGTGPTDGIVSIGNALIAAYSGGYYLSTDIGASWKPRSGIYDEFLSSGSVLFAISGDGDCWSILFSTDSAETWKDISPSISCLAFFSAAQSDGHFLIGTGFTQFTENLGILSSSDSGADWTSANSGLPNPNLTTVTSLLVDGHNIFAGMYCGDTEVVFCSSNDGSSWFNVSQGLNAPDVNTLVVSGTNLYAGTIEAGVWRRPLSEMIGSNSVEVPLIAETSTTAYPNPFTQSTTISFTSPENGAAEVTIVNLLGAEVARLFEGELSAGEHTFTWNAANMPPGTYWAVVRMNGGVQQVPMVVTQ